MTQQDAARTYDDLPESDVSTVLQVPLLWGSEKGTHRPAVGAHRRPSGRHRADARAAGRPKPQPRVPGLLRQPEVRQPEVRQQRVAPTPGWTDHPMAHTARVGLVSAGLVLGLFAGVLLALALWLP